MSRKPNPAMAFVCAGLCSLFLALAASGQEVDGKPDEKEQPKPVAVTADDATVPLEHLRLLVKPLTRDELAVEAEAWRQLLKRKVEEISNLQIGVKEHRDRVEQVKEEVDQVQQDVEQAKADRQADTDAAPAIHSVSEQAGAAREGEATEQADQAIDQAEKAAATAGEAAEAAQEAVDAADDLKQKQAEVSQALPELQEERAELIDRMNVVLDAWEDKGGEVEEYRQYATAVSGIDVDVTDAATTWTAIRGWLVSEQGGLRWLWNIGKFLIIAFAFYLLSVILGKITEHLAGRIKGASELLKKFLGTFVRQLTIIVGLIVAASALELNISPLLAAIGGAAFVIGLALQGTLSNFASGLIILGYRPFDVGDVIEAAGITGIVDSMNLISTKIRTFDNKVMIVPNNKIATDTITNATASAERRVDMTFGIGYTDDIEKAHALLESVVKQHPQVLDEPAPTIQVNELGDSSVNFIVRPWSKTADYWKVYWDVTRSVKEEFDRNGISIPFPQRDIHVYHETVTNGSEAERPERQHS